MRLPQGIAFGNWDFPTQTFQTLTFEFEIRGNIDDTPGRFYQLYDGGIGGVGSYFGLQTNLWHPVTGWSGPGLIFSRWGKQDESDARVAQNGWVETSKHEGEFVGVRAPMSFEQGEYCGELKSKQLVVGEVWYEFSVTNCCTCTTTSCGHLRFPNDVINSGGGTWIEVYSDVKDEMGIPYTELRMKSIKANGGVVKPSACRVSYNNQFSQSDARVINGQLVLQAGRRVTRLYPPQTYNL